MEEKIFNPLADMSRIKDSLMQLFRNTKDITHLIMPYPENENFTFDQNWFGGKFDRNVKGKTEITTLIGHCFDVPYIEGTITDNRCSIFIETYLIRVGNEHMKQVGVDVFVICHKDSVRLSEEDTEYYNSIGVYGNRVDSAIQVINSAITNPEIMAEIQKKYSIGDLTLLERNPIDRYIPGTKFYGKCLHYTYHTFNQRKSKVK